MSTAGDGVRPSGAWPEPSGSPASGLESRPRPGALQCEAAPGDDPCCPPDRRCDWSRRPSPSARWRGRRRPVPATLDSGAQRVRRSSPAAQTNSADAAHVDQVLMVRSGIARHDRREGHCGRTRCTIPLPLKMAARKVGARLRSRLTLGTVLWRRGNTSDDRGRGQLSVGAGADGRPLRHAGARRHAPRARGHRPGPLAEDGSSGAQAQRTPWRPRPRSPTTTDLAAALDGADFVIVCISTGGFRSMAVDLDVPAAHGITQTVGDTVGPGGHQPGPPQHPGPGRHRQGDGGALPRRMAVQHHEPHDLL